MGSVALSGSGTVGLMPSACQLRPVRYTHWGARGATMIRPWTLGLSARPGSVEIVRDMPSLDREVKAVPDSQFGPDREGFSLLRRRLTRLVEFF